MFHFGLVGGFKPGLQRSVTSDFPSAFPRRQSGAFPQSEFAFCSLQPPAVASGPSEVTWPRGKGCTGFSGPHQNKGPVLSTCHLDFW